MTIVLAVADGNCAILGCDSACTADDALTFRSGVAKAWSFEHCGYNFLAGFAGNFAEGNFVRHVFKWPRLKWNYEIEDSLENWFHASVQPALFEAMKKRFEGRDLTWNDMSWELLVIVKKSGTSERCRIFKLYQCGDVEEAFHFATLGSGGTAALASLQTMFYMNSQMTSWDMADVAMRIAEKNYISVRGPFHFLSLV